MMQPDPSDASVDLSALSGQLGRALRQAQLAVAQDFLRTVGEADIRPAGYGVLAILRRNPGLSATRVAGALGIKRTNFVGLLDALQARGLLRREAVAGDRRTSALTLTGEGEALLARLEEAVVAHEARFVRRLGAGGREQLLSLLARLRDPAFD